MGDGETKGGNLGDGETKGGNLGKAQSAMKTLKANLRQVSVAAGKLSAKSKTLPKAVQGPIAQLAAVKSAIAQADKLGSSLKGLQNKKKG